MSEQSSVNLISSAFIGETFDVAVFDSFVAKNPAAVSLEMLGFSNNTN